MKRLREKKKRKTLVGSLTSNTKGENIFSKKNYKKAKQIKKQQQEKKKKKRKKREVA